MWDLGCRRQDRLSAFPRPDKLRLRSSHGSRELAVFSLSILDKRNGAYQRIAIVCQEGWPLASGSGCGSWVVLRPDCQQGPCGETKLRTDNMCITAFLSVLNMLKRAWDTPEVSVSDGRRLVMCGRHYTLSGERATCIPFFLFFFKPNFFQGDGPGCHCRNVRYFVSVGVFVACHLP